MILAVDIGFGNTKFKTEKIRGIKRTVVSKEGIVSLGNGKQLQTVDELIEYSPSVIYSLMKELGITDSVATVAVGLPLASYTPELKIELKDRLRTFDKVFVYPQSLAYLYANGDGLVIDIGHNTVITCVTENKKVVYSKTYYRKGSIEIASQLQNILMPMLTRIGKSFNNIELDEIVLNRKIQIGLDIIDISSEIESIQREYITGTIKMVLNDIKTCNKLLNFNRLYLIGGIAKDIKIQSQKIQIIIPEEPIFANVNAYFDLASMEVEI